MISVIVPVYNARPYLHRCVDSILNQTYVDLEVLLIDDGCTDGSGEICDEYSIRDNRCKVIHQDNAGVADARNVGLKIAIGDYITFVDDDDWIHPSYLEYLHRAINEGDGYDMSMTLCVFERIQKDAYYRPVRYSTRTVSSEIMMKILVSDDHHVQYEPDIPYRSVWSRLYRRKLLEGVFFKNICGEDYEYNSRILPKIKEVILVPERMYHWIYRSSSLSYNYTDRQISSWIDCHALCLENIPIENEECRGLCLRELYKRMLIFRYNARQYKNDRLILVECIRKTRMVGNRTLHELMRNKYITSIDKFFLISMFHIPFLYAIYRWTIHIKTKIFK